MDTGESPAVATDTGAAEVAPVSPVAKPEMSNGGRFIALRALTVKSGKVQSGDAVPEATYWPERIVVAEVNAGNIYDLERRYTLRGGHRAATKREQDLLKACVDGGALVEVGMPDGSTRHELAANVTTLEEVDAAEAELAADAATLRTEAQAIEAEATAIEQAATKKSKRGR